MMKWLLPVGAVAAVVYYGVKSMREREEDSHAPADTPTPASMPSSDPKLNRIINNALTPEEQKKMLEDKAFLDSVVNYTASR
jgi:hypothetical protein